jgi:Asp-tRNA(Asn)/Glu-tRNA(Gln) amidotransferase A subunit family amidase
MGDVWNEGMTRNPFDLEQGASGSSAGSASAVAAGLVGFAIGSETLGSIVSPSTRCGVTGLRPTFGRVPRGGAMPLAWSMDKLGPMARTVEDTALVLDAINGYDFDAARRDPALLDVPFNFSSRASLDGLRVGFDASEFKGKEHTLDRAARTLLQGTGIDLVQVKLPSIPVRTLFPALMVEAAASFDELTRNGDDAKLRRQSDDAWPNGFRATRMVPAVEYMQMRRLRRRAMEGMRDFYEKFDLAAFLSPASMGTMLPLSNFTGHPSLTLRTGFAADGRPHAVTLTGRLFDEGSLLRIGIALEQAADCWHVRPNLDP